MTTTNPIKKYKVALATDLPDREPVERRAHIPYWKTKSKNPRRLLTVVVSEEEALELWPDAKILNIEPIESFRFSLAWCPRWDWFEPLPGEEGFWLAPKRTERLGGEREPLLELAECFDARWLNWYWEMERQFTGVGFGLEDLPSPPPLAEENFAELDLWVDATVAEEHCTMCVLGNKLVVFPRRLYHVYMYDLVTQKWTDELGYNSCQLTANEVRLLGQALVDEARTEYRRNTALDFLRRHSDLSSARAVGLINALLALTGCGVVSTEFYGRPSIRFFTPTSVLEYLYQGLGWAYLRTEPLTAQYLVDYCEHTVRTLHDAVVSDDSDAVTQILEDVHALLVGSGTNLGSWVRQIRSEAGFQQEQYWGVVSVGKALMIYSRWWRIACTPEQAKTTCYPVELTKEEFSAQRIYFELFEEALENVYNEFSNSQMWLELNANRLREPEGFDAQLQAFMSSCSYVDNPLDDAAKLGDVYSFGRFSVSMDATLTLVPNVPSLVQELSADSYAPQRLPEYLRAARRLQCGYRAFVSTDYTVCRDMLRCLLTDGLDQIAVSSQLAFTDPLPELPSNRLVFEPVWILLGARGSTTGVIIIYIAPGSQRWSLSKLSATLRGLLLRPARTTDHQDWVSVLERELHGRCQEAVGQSLYDTIKF